MTLRRVPLLAWIAAGVIVAHALFFYLVAHSHFLPNARYVPPPTPAVNFGVSAGPATLDPRTGEVVTEHDFTVSTRLATVPPSPTVAPQAVH